MFKKIHDKLNNTFLKTLSNQTPFFIFDKKVLLANFRKYKICLPAKTEICYAMKANSEKPVLETLHKAGASFEVASKYELALLKEMNVSGERIIYGTSVKPENHIQEFVSYGVNRFAFDSLPELFKIWRQAPGAYVYVRVLVDDKSDSVFHMSEKFGTSLEEGINLLVKAKELGLVPYGISFNVGSQARNSHAWARGIHDISRMMKILLKKDIKIKTINIGGGFPYNYQNDNHIPDIKEISRHIYLANKKLPYPVTYIAEPGRGLVANAFALVTSVIGNTKRLNGHWLYLDAGAYSALLEAMIFQGSMRYRTAALYRKNFSRTKENFILTGPTGDALDVINSRTVLPKNIEIGDKLVIYDTGAYTFTLTVSYNGFPKPKILVSLKNNSHIGEINKNHLFGQQIIRTLTSNLLT